MELELKVFPHGIHYIFGVMRASGGGASLPKQFVSCKLTIASSIHSLQKSLVSFFPLQNSVFFLEHTQRIVCHFYIE
jgi:uncharacterized membrane protein SpoIIM required for sporulation